MTHWLIIARGCACTWCVPGLTQCCFVALQQLVACVCQRSSDSAAMAMTTSDAAAVPGTPAAAACFGRGYCGGYCGVPGAKWCGVQSKQCPWTRKYETYHPTYIKLSDPTPKGPPAYNIYVMIYNRCAIPRQFVYNTYIICTTKKTISLQYLYLHILYAICTYYLYNVCTILVQCVYNTYTICLGYLYIMSTICT